MGEFIWTEALGCAEILEPMLLSFNKHHPNTEIRVIIYERDREIISKMDWVMPVLVNDVSKLASQNEMERAFSRGHVGTALLWSRIIRSNPDARLIHFDSDLVFLGEVLSVIRESMDRGSQIVGPRRPYRHGPKLPYPHRVFQGLMPDSVHTYAFGFQTGPLSRMPEDKLQEMIFGAKRRSIGNVFRPNLDFFDRVTRALSKGMAIDYLDGVSTRHGVHNPDSNFNKLLITFAGVGSGFALHRSGGRPENPYQDFAITSFATYSKYLLNLDLGLPELTDPYLMSQVKRLNKASWTLDSE